MMMGIVNGDVPHLPSKFDKELNDIFSRRDLIYFLDPCSRVGFLLYHSHSGWLCRRFPRNVSLFFSEFCA